MVLVVDQDSRIHLGLDRGWEVLELQSQGLQECPFQGFRHPHWSQIYHFQLQNMNHHLNHHCWTSSRDQRHHPLFVWPAEGPNETMLRVFDQWLSMILHEHQIIECVIEVFG